MLPQRLVFSAFHNIGIFDLMASVTWVDWSAIQNVTLDPVALPIQMAMMTNMYYL